MVRAMHFQKCLTILYLITIVIFWVVGSSDHNATCTSVPYHTVWLENKNRTVGIKEANITVH